jgi:hypothetical protein
MSRCPALFIALLCTSVAPAFAQGTTPHSQTIEVSGAAVPLPPSATLHAMTGDFALSDGRRLQVLRPGLHLMAKIDRRFGVSLEPIGEHRFASRNGRLLVEFLPASDGGFDSLRVIENDQVTVAARSLLLR